MDDRKWAKVPDIPADSFMLDLEDSVSPALKEAARDKAVQYLAQPDYFQHKPVLARPNHLSTPWGKDDLVALAEAGVGCLAYPKVGTVEELDEVRAILNAHGADPDVFAIVETADGVLNAAAIARHPSVCGLMFGPGDLSVDSGITLLTAGGELNPALVAPKVHTVLAGAAAGVPTADIAYLTNIRDLDEARRKYQDSQLLGFTTGITFYPPHVPVVNAVFGPSEQEVARALEIVDAYEQVRSRGETAVTLADGRVLLVHDYEKALVVRARARAIGLA
ncbi:CoA ester lyase [Phytohabitans sp. ZYX-F-186]|uniref:CoA ester lyase n=1 Tax=Phytohabitans maris TaxID=3071409 RepID=A0ABU0ZUW9_9ACTN|nr:CoA ester lyase [Phytohabitans sp. ZYX-F-186]MDQ7910841.1 CoA ester lyase [Phytohabitans sp. ZYX-F-186]